MRVIQVLAGASRGGAETAFEEISLALSAAGIEQKIITRSKNKERIKRFQDAGISIETLPFGGFFDFYTRWKIKKIIADYKPQIVQTWMSRATEKTPSSKKPQKYLKVARLGGYYGLKYYKGTDYYIANTPDIKDYLVREGIDKEEIRVINNFSADNPTSAPLTRSEFNTPDDATVILSLARYHHVKALDVLIKAAAEIENIHVWLAGEGPLEQELRQLAAELGIAERIHFLGWRDDRSALLQAADICVFPSRHEPFGTVFVQAWAHKIPLICSKSQGPSQYVRDGEDGLMFDIDNVSQLVQSIKTIIADKNLADRLVDEGYKHYQTEFTREKIIENYISFYQEIIERHNLNK